MLIRRLVPAGVDTPTAPLHPEQVAAERAYPDDLGDSVTVRYRNHATGSKRLDYLLCSEGFATRPALHQEPELGPPTGSALRTGTEIGETLTSRLADGRNLGKVRGVDVHWPRSSCA